MPAPFLPLGSQRGANGKATALLAGTEQASPPRGRPALRQILGPADDRLSGASAGRRCRLRGRVLLCGRGRWRDDNQNVTDDLWPFRCNSLPADYFAAGTRSSSRRGRAPGIQFCVNSVASHQVEVQVSQSVSRSPQRSLRCCPQQRGGDRRPADIRATCTSSARPPRSQTRERRSAYLARTPR